MTIPRRPEGGRFAFTYLKLVEVAESFGVAERVVEGWIRNERMPHTVDSGRVLFERDRVAHWAASRGLTTRAGFLAPETRTLETDCRLEPMLRAGGIHRDVPGARLMDVLEEIVSALPATPAIRTLLAKRLRAPGGLTMAPVSGGLAFPHLSERVSLGRGSGVLALLLLKDPVPMPEPAAGEPLVRLFFFIAPSPRTHLEVLGRLSSSLTRGPLRALVMTAATDEAILAAVRDADTAASAAADPPGAP